MAQRVLFTCGGSAGHINPGIALAGMLRSRRPQTEILFVGAIGSIEEQLVPKAGYEIRLIPISGFWRGNGMKTLRHNVRAAYLAATSGHTAKGILREFRPDLVLATGGYVSYPMIKYAAKMGIPTAIHESNAVPGLTTKMVAPYCDRVMVGFEDCRSAYPHPERVVVTGTPARGDFFDLTREQARQRLGLGPDMPLVVSFWGSLGARDMNRMMVDFLACEVKDRAFRHIHAAGASGYPMMMELLKERGIDLESEPLTEVREYIYDMAVVMRAADLVLCRAGASTIAELTALGMPALMVPSPYVPNNHQEKNARVLEKHGGARVMLEKDLTGRQLYDAVRGLLADREGLAAMGREMLHLGAPDAAERIYEQMIGLMK